MVSEGVDGNHAGGEVYTHVPAHLRWGINRRGHVFLEGLAEIHKALYYGTELFFESRRPVAVLCSTAVAPLQLYLTTAILALTPALALFRPHAVPNHTSDSAIPRQGAGNQSCLLERGPIR